MERSTDGSVTGGRTPLVELDGIFVKLECANPTGSVKDRIADFILRQAAARGELAPGDTVVEATSGNTGIALASVCRERGHRLIIFMPEHMSSERRRILARLGAEVRLTPRAESFAGAVAQRDAYRDRRGYFVPDQFGNRDNTLCHRLTTGRELLAQLSELGIASVDAFVAGVGTGGTLMGVGVALRELFPKARLIAVEPVESAVMAGGEAGEHGIQGIGDGFVPDLVDLEAVDDVLTVSSADALEASDGIRRRHGYCVGVSAGANFVAGGRLRDRGMAVATLFPDCSNRYGSMGLEPPGAADVTCPLRAACCQKSARLLA